MHNDNLQLTTLKKHALFSKLSEEELTLLLSNARSVSYGSQEVIFSQDADAQYFYFVVSGTIRLYRIAPNGNEKVIEIMEAGETFAEAVMFMDQPNYPVTAETTKKSELIMMKNSDFHSILMKRPDICLKMLGSLSMRLHLRLNELEILSLQSATDRVVHYLLSKLPNDANNGFEITLEIPKRVLASRLSMLPETFSRVLHKLTEKSIISVKSRKITVENIEELKQNFSYNT